MDVLIQAKRKTDRYREIGRTMDRLKDYYQALEKKSKALGELVLYEEQDVEEIKDNKAFKLMLSLCGKLGERRDKEESEALAVRLLFEQTKNEIIGLTAQLDALQEEQSGLVNATTIYEQLYEQRKHKLIRDNDDIGSEISLLSEKVSREKVNLENTSKVLGIVLELLEVLRNAANSLEKAEECSFQRHSILEDVETRSDHIDNATAHVEHARQLFYEYKAAAEQCGLTLDVTVNSGLVTVEILLNGLIARWFSLNRLTRAYLKIETMRSEIYTQVLKLQQLENMTQSRISSLSSQLDEYVLSSLPKEE